MRERRPLLDLVTHLALVAGAAVVLFPVYLAFVASTHTAQTMAQAPVPLWPGPELWNNLAALLRGQDGQGQVVAPVGRMLWISGFMAVSIAIGKIVISLLSAFALVYFRFPWKRTVFWAIFVTLMLPVEVRILPTYEVIAGLGLVNSYAGLTVPLMASATATFLFRQFFLTVPDELVEAARTDGASPMRFFFDVLAPLSRTSIAALFVIQFIYGWNQYLWPLLISTSEDMYPIVMGIRRLVAGSDSQVQWNLAMAAALLAMLPPALVVMLMQKWFVKGLVDSEK